MRPSRFFTRPRILTGVLSILVILWTHLLIETHFLEHGLKKVADDKAREMFDGTLPDGTRIDSVARVTASRDYVLFGPTRGKVHLHLRSQSPESRAVFYTYDAFYVLEGHNWVETESGVCADLPAQHEARAAFAALP